MACLAPRHLARLASLAPCQPPLHSTPSIHPLRPTPTTLLQPLTSYHPSIFSTRPFNQYVPSPLSVPSLPYSFPLSLPSSPTPSSPLSLPPSLPMAFPTFVVSYGILPIHIYRYDVILYQIARKSMLKKQPLLTVLPHHTVLLSFSR